MPAPSNRTITIDPLEETQLLSACMGLADLGKQILPTDLVSAGRCSNKLVLGDALSALTLLPADCMDLVIVDPPYNLSKNFHGFNFSAREFDAYLTYARSWIPELARVLKPGGSLYICAEWRSSAAIQIAVGEHLDIRNRLTWEREKGRGAKSNWKNASEDIWFCTKGDHYYFNVDAVKLRRRVRAPYRNADGQARDWAENDSGSEKWRDTYPSNLWTDLTVPFWSMPENTAHPTQKPEKLLAKLLLASSRPDDLVFDPFAGSGTTLVTAHKLGRRWFGIEQNPLYAALAIKRLRSADSDRHIQGYEDGVFWERNSLVGRNKR